MRTADKIDKLGEWEFGDAANEVCDDAGDASQTMEGKLTCDVGCPGPVTLLLEGICEGDEPDTNVVVSTNLRQEDCSSLR